MKLTYDAQQRRCLIHKLEVTHAVGQLSRNHARGSVARVGVSLLFSGRKHDQLLFKMRILRTTDNR